MSCQKYDADLVDLARGVELSVAITKRVHAHMEQCAACADRFAREQHLTGELRTLAGSAPPPVRLAAIEQQLLQAFAARHASASRSAFAMGGARWWLAAAAVLILAVVGWFGSGQWRPDGESGPAPTRVKATPTAPVSTQVRATPAEPRQAIAAAGGPAEAPVPTPPAVAEPVRRSLQPRQPPGDVKSSVPAGSDRVLRFVALPSAAGLPGLESGRIVRVELPMSILPAYGFDVVPEAAARVVEADVLVGQDGEPRAIRFVNSDSDPRRRQ
jgi:hypothetical protein